MEVQIFEYTRFEMSDANVEVNEFLYDLKNWGAEINYVKQSLAVNYDNLELNGDLEKSVSDAIDILRAEKNRRGF